MFDMEKIHSTHSELTKLINELMSKYGMGEVVRFYSEAEDGVYVCYVDTVDPEDENYTLTHRIGYGGVIFMLHHPKGFISMHVKSIPHNLTLDTCSAILNLCKILMNETAVKVFDKLAIGINGSKGKNYLENITTAWLSSDYPFFKCGSILWDGKYVYILKDRKPHEFYKLLGKIEVYDIFEAMGVNPSDKDVENLLTVFGLLINKPVCSNYGFGEFF